MSEVIRVAIVDDHPALAEGTSAILERESDLAVVATASSLAEARMLLDEDRRIDVLVLDVRLADGTGLTLLGEIGGRERAALAVVIWTGFDISQYAYHALRMGAAGFVHKSSPVAELVDAIRIAAHGGLHFAVDVRAAPTTFSQRERQVIAGVIAGQSNDEIAGSLGVTRRAVELHLTHLYRRHGLRSRAELAARAEREGWLDIPD